MNMGGGVRGSQAVRSERPFTFTYTATTMSRARAAARRCTALHGDIDRSHPLEAAGLIMPAYKGKWKPGMDEIWRNSPEKITASTGVYLADADWTAYADVGRLLQRSGALDRGAGFIQWYRAARHLSIPPWWTGPCAVHDGKGIFLIYNGADEKSVYRAGWVVFDKNDPTKVIGSSDERSSSPLSDEKSAGAECVFVEGLGAPMASDWLFYYGV